MCSLPVFEPAGLNACGVWSSEFVCFKMAAQVIEVESLPIVDFDLFLNKKDGWEVECAKVKDSLYRTGLLIVQDPVRRKRRSDCTILMNLHRTYGIHSYVLDLDLTACQGGVQRCVLGHDGGLLFPVRGGAGTTKMECLEKSF